MGIAPPVVVLLAIVAAAAVTAVAAAMHRVYSNRGRPSDPENTDAMIASFSNEQSHYMRDVRMRNQLQAWGVAPAFEDSYMAPRSQLAAGPASTAMSYG
ncbi:hypothetical protein H2198_003894 [Neophaeococcomyces mojaviensis]|uniref:Uncharacterized protein n=1 Tax=Neophaeococcomyces mojaviensis TaxID=3383035 RepID=A0ACC3AAI4_9EURO|nr:hypothetical protein H2198_003894 [Knufia sp. JES_112]